MSRSLFHQQKQHPDLSLDALIAKIKDTRQDAISTLESYAAEFPNAGATNAMMEQANLDFHAAYKGMDMLKDSVLNIEIKQDALAAVEGLQMAGYSRASTDDTIQGTYNETLTSIVLNALQVTHADIAVEKAEQLQKLAKAKGYSLTVSPLKADLSSPTMLVKLFDDSMAALKNAPEKKGASFTIGAPTL